MQAGMFDSPAVILRLDQKGDTCEWQEAGHIWTKAEPQSKTNLFSKVGLGQKSIRFTMRKRELTLHDAIRWQGKHCFLTDIKELDRMYLEVTAALIDPVSCAAFHTAQTLDALNRPAFKDTRIAAFPGFLTEKYLGFEQKEVHAETKTTYVLVTPKAIVLQSGDLVQAGEDFYTVKIIHILDEYKNEYEITMGRDN